MQDQNFFSELEDLVDAFAKEAKAIGYIVKEQLAHVLGYDEQYGSEKIRKLWVKHTLEGGIKPKGDNEREKIEAWYYILRRLTTGIDYRCVNLVGLSVQRLSHYAYVQKKMSYVKVDPDDEKGAFIKLADLEHYFPYVLKLPLPQKLYPQEVAFFTESKNEPGLKASSDGFKNNPDEFIKSLTVRFENDSQISIQQKGKPKKNVDLTGLGFRAGGGVTWDNFLTVLKNSPKHYWQASKDSDRKQIKTVNDRLIAWINTGFGNIFPDDYKLYRRNKAAGLGIYEFSFNIEYEETDPVQKESIRKKFFTLVEEYKTIIHSNAEVAQDKRARLEDRINALADQGLRSKVLTNREVEAALTPTRKETDWKEKSRQAFEFSKNA